jgi:hypothetical protein
VLSVELLRRQLAGAVDGYARQLRERLEHLADCVIDALDRCIALRYTLT